MAARISVLRRQLTSGHPAMGWNDVVLPQPTSPRFGPAEWELRCKLAVAYRMARLMGWDQLIFNHITAKIPKSESEPNGPHFLINPLGLRFDEMTASSLLKVTVGGEVLDSGIGAGGLFRQGYVIHSAIHEARPDAKCVWHCHHEDTAAIAMTKTGVLPLSQEVIGLMPLLAYHPFEGTANDMSERPRLQSNLGQTKLILMLSNHGPCTIGKDVESAFLLMYSLTRACTYQQKAMAAVGGDLSKLNLPSADELAAMERRSSAPATDPSLGGGSGADASAELIFRSVARIIEDRDGCENIYC